MDELVEGIKAVGHVINESPCLIDRLCATLDKWNLLPFSERRKKNAFDKMAIQQQLEIQQQEHKARLDFLNTSIKIKCMMREKAAQIALEAAKQDVEQGMSVAEALKKHDPFLERSSTQLLVDTLEAQYARERIALYALDAALEIPDEPIGDGKTSATWTSRFWEYAKGVRDEEAMRQWGKLLIGEIKSPGSISLKTLDILRNLDSDEAKKFSRIAPYFISGIFMPDKETKKALNITEYDLVSLESVGIIAGDKSIDLCENEYLYETRFFYIHFILDKEFDFSVKVLTRYGNDLYHICDIAKDDDYHGAINFIEMLKKNGIEATISEKVPPLTY